MLPKLRVHIIFVGNLKTDNERSLAGVKMQKADKIHLVTMKGEDKYPELYEETKNWILNDNVVPSSALIEERVDYYDVLEVMKLCARIIKDERKQGNDVYFSLSSGGKLLSASITLSCAIFDACLYYIKRDYPGTGIDAITPVITFPAFHVEPPEPDLIKFMHALLKSQSSKQELTFSKKNCLDICKQLFPKDFKPPRKNESGNYNKMRIKFLDNLEKLKYITVENKARGHVTITNEGMFAHELFSTYYDLPE